jgi:hypothetical protein
MAGTSAGSALGPWGAIGGGALGFIGGGLSGGDERGSQWAPSREDYNLPGYQDIQGRYGGLLGQGPRQAPQIGQSGFRGGQQQLSEMLMAQARGQGPGQEIARQQAQQQVDRGVGQQLGMARSARPGQSAMAARNAAMASGQLQGAGAQAATMGGLQAQQMATGQLGGVLQGARGQDLARAGQQAELDYRTMGLDDARQLELLRQSLGAAQAQQAGGMGYQNMLAGRYGAAQGQPTGFERAMGAAGGLGQGLMQMRAGQQPGRQPYEGVPYGRGYSAGGVPNYFGG